MSGFRALFSACRERVVVAFSGLHGHDGQLVLQHRTMLWFRRLQDHEQHHRYHVQQNIVCVSPSAHEPFYHLSVIVSIQCTGLWRLHVYVVLDVSWTVQSGLEQDLQLKLHGQHLVQSVVLRAVQGFINNPESNKPLTLSFHGWSGTGKNFVARLVADNLYRDGIKSECVRLFIAPFHFPHARLVDVYKVSWSHSGFRQGLLFAIG